MFDVRQWLHSHLIFADYGVISTSKCNDIKKQLLAGVLSACSYTVMRFGVTGSGHNIVRISEFSCSVQSSGHAET